MRYYYKDKDGNKYSFKTEPLITIEDGEETIIEDGHEVKVPKYKEVLDSRYIEITEEEFKAQLSISTEIKARQEKNALITQKQARLEIVKWKIEQVDLFHEVRSDIDALRTEARVLHAELENLKKNV